MFDDVTGAVKGFIKEHQSLILWIAVLFLADHFFFQAKFRTRLHAMIDGMITKVEEKVKGAA